MFCPLLLRPNGETFKYVAMISSFEKYFSTCAERMISFALRLNVVSSVRICCLTNCCVKVDPPEEPIPVASDTNARKTALGT